MNQVFLYTDGSCKGNPGPGGYAAILQSGAHEKTFTGSEAQATNNRMELQAVIAGLSALKRRCQVPDRANRDLVQQVRALQSGHHLRVQLVAGHSGHAMNERCDALAQAAARQLVA